MKRVMFLAGVLMLVSAPLYAYVSSGSMSGKRGWNKLQGYPTTTTTTATDPAISDPVVADPDPTIGLIEVREPRETCQEPGHPVPEPGTMAITSMGLLAAAAWRRKRGQKQA
jgi:PEP-CTERM motif-containing protein